MHCPRPHLRYLHRKGSLFSFLAAATAAATAATANGSDSDSVLVATDTMQLTVFYSPFPSLAAILQFMVLRLLPCFCYC